MAGHSDFGEASVPKSQKTMRGQYSQKRAPKTMSPEMDKWEREQQKKHTREKRIKRDVKKLIREVTAE